MGNKSSQEKTDSRPKKGSLDVLTFRRTSDRGSSRRDLPSEEPPARRRARSMPQNPTQTFPVYATTSYDPRQDIQANRPRTEYIDSSVMPIRREPRRRDVQSDPPPVDRRVRNPFGPAMIISPSFGGPAMRDPFGGRSLFGGLDNLMRQSQAIMESSMAHGMGGQTMMSSSGRDGGGVFQSFTSSTFTKIGADGVPVSESKAVHQDSSGKLKMAHQRRIGGKSQTLTRRRRDFNHLFEDQQHLRQLGHEELPTFDQEFKDRARLGSSFGRDPRSYGITQGYSDRSLYDQRDSDRRRRRSKDYPKAIEPRNG